MTGHLNGMGGSLTVKLVTTAGVANNDRERKRNGDDDGIINIVEGCWGERGLGGVIGCWGGLDLCK